MGLLAVVAALELYVLVIERVVYVAITGPLFVPLIMFVDDTCVFVLEATFGAVDDEIVFFVKSFVKADENLVKTLTEDEDMIFVVFVIPGFDNVLEESVYVTPEPVKPYVVKLLFELNLGPGNVVLKDLVGLSDDVSIIAVVEIEVVDVKLVVAVVVEVVVVVVEVTFVSAAKQN
jgi:hypothetical protein